MKRLLIIIILNSLMILMISCANKSEEELYPLEVCDLQNVTYSVTVRSILDNNCVYCHSGPSANGNPQVLLDNYNGVKTVADNGRLYNALSGVYIQMPPSGKLPECTISQVKSWITNGSPEN